MDRQGFEEPTGQAKITPAFNLPCDYVIHTVGPIVQGALTKKHERLLRSCYESCLQLAVAHEVKSIAFCLHLHRRISFPESESSGDCSSYSRKIPREIRKRYRRNLQCIQGF